MPAFLSSWAPVEAAPGEWGGLGIPAATSAYAMGAAGEQRTSCFPATGAPLPLCTHSCQSYYWGLSDCMSHFQNRITWHACLAWQIMNLRNGA